MQEAGSRIATVPRGGSSSNSVPRRQHMTSQHQPMSSSGQQQQYQQSIQIPIVTFSTIVPVPDVAGELPCASEIGGNSSADSQTARASMAMGQSTAELQQREQMLLCSGRDAAVDTWNVVTTQLFDSFQQAQLDLGSMHQCVISPLEVQTKCPVDDMMDSLCQMHMHKREMEESMLQSGSMQPMGTVDSTEDMAETPVKDGSDKLLSSAAVGVGSNPGEDFDDEDKVGQVINPELALPTKTSPMSHSHVNMNFTPNNFTNGKLFPNTDLDATSVSLGTGNNVNSTFSNSASKLSSGASSNFSSRPTADLTSALFSKSVEIKLSQIKTPQQYASQGQPSISPGAGDASSFKPLSIKLTPIDPEMAEKALRGKKITEVTFSKSHREERGLFDYLSHQFIPTSSKRYSALKSTDALDKKGQKRKREDGGSDDDNDDGDLFAPDDGMSKNNNNNNAAVKVVEPAWKKRKYNRVHSLHDRQMNKKEIKDSSEFKRCALLLDTLLESVDEGYLSKSSSSAGAKHSKKKKKHRPSNSDAEEDLNLDETSREDDAVDALDTDRLSCPPELQVKRATLSELTTECSKLKWAEIMNVIPVEKLTKLLSVLEHNIRDGTKLALSSRSRQGMPATDKNKDAWREMVLDRVWRAAEASLLALTVLTAPNMPKRVYMEELFETTIKFLQYQFNNTIFPEFDPIYRISKEDKEKGDASIKAKRAKVATVKEKGILGLYNRFCEIVILLSDLFTMQVMTDSIVLQVSSLGISVFFVENISELQLATLRLVTTVFAKYSKHRQLIFQEMFSSLSKLPSSKRSLRPFRITEEEHIQMVTALVLQLIQSVINLPSQSELEAFVNQSATAALAGEKDQDKYSSSKNGSCSGTPGMDIDEILNNCSAESYRTTQTFLSVFLTKCTAKSDEDFRPLFENFVQDLLTTVNKPEWPASEVALSLLGRLLNFHFTAKASDTAMRVACLDYLGVIAARLRKDAVTSKCSRKDIESVVAELKSDSKALINFEDDEDEGSNFKETFSQQLQRVILDYLQDLSDTEPSLLYAKGYYIAQWYRDMRLEIERCSKLLDCSTRESQAQGHMLTPAELMQKVEESEKQKSFLLSLIHAKPGSGIDSLRNAHLNLSYENACLIASYLASERPFMKSFDVYLRQIIAVLAEPSVAIRTKAVKCLTAVVEADPTLLSRIELQHAVKSMFVDSSSSVREAAVDLLSRFVLLQDDLPEKYYGMIANRILDTGISVRKRVVRILRDICIEKPDFPKNTEICCKLIRRINDEESIRKLVLEVFEKLWFTPVSPTYSASHGGTSKAVQTKISQIVETLRQSTDTGFEGFQTLLSILVKHDSNCNSNAVKALAEIVDGIVEYMVNLEESEDLATGASSGRIHSAKLMSCFSVLFHIAKIKPTLLVPHANELQPYLATKVSNEFDSMILFYTAAIFEITVPLISNPSDTLLTSVQEELMKVIMNGGQNALSKCVSCLTTVVMKVTKNYETLNDCVDKFFSTLTKIRACQELASRQGGGVEPDYIGKAKGSLSRALYALGLLAQKYDPLQFSKVGLSTPLYQQLRSPTSMSNCTTSSSEDRVNHTPTTPLNSSNRNSASEGSKVKFSELVAEHMLYYARCNNTDVVAKALTGLGFICSAHPDLLLWEKVKSLYFEILQQSGASSVVMANSPGASAPGGVAASSAGPNELRELVLHNLEQYLVAEDERLQEADEEFKQMRMNEDSTNTLKEMGDINSGMASSIIQIYSTGIFNNFFAPQSKIRAQALKVISLVLKQGLVQPVNCVPYLIALSSDTDHTNRIKAHEQLIEIDTKYPGFVHQKASQGLSLAFMLHKNLRPGYELIRGYRIEYEGQAPNQTCHIEACCSSLYSLIRTQRNNRRALVKPLLAMFDSAHQFSLRELLFFADNLAAFKYLMQDEVFFIIHIIDIQLSISGSNILTEFKHMFYPERKMQQQQQQQNFDQNKVPQHQPMSNCDGGGVYMSGQSTPNVMSHNGVNQGLYNIASSNTPMYGSVVNPHMTLQRGQGDAHYSQYLPLQSQFTQAQYGQQQTFMAAQNQGVYQTPDQLPLYHQPDLNALASFTGSMNATHGFNNQMGSMNMQMNCADGNLYDYNMQYMQHNQQQGFNGDLSAMLSSPNLDSARKESHYLHPQQMNQMGSNPQVMHQSPVGQGHKMQQRNCNEVVVANPVPDDDDLEDENSLFGRYPEEDSALIELMKQSHSCILLCLLKQHLKTVYSVTDSKFQNYSPNEAVKVFEKSMSRKSAIKFEPSLLINYIQFGGYQSPVVDPQQRLNIVRHYLEFKELMMQLDASDEDENGEPIARPLYYLNQQQNNKYSASASVSAPNAHNASLQNNSSEPLSAEATDQQILKNASFMERMQKKSKKGRKSLKKTPVKKKGRKRVVIHSDSEEESHEEDDSDPDFN